MKCKCHQNGLGPTYIRHI